MSGFMNLRVWQDDAVTTRGSGMSALKEGAT